MTCLIQHPKTYENLRTIEVDVHFDAISGSENLLGHNPDAFFPDPRFRGFYKVFDCITDYPSINRAPERVVSPKSISRSAVDCARNASFAAQSLGKAFLDLVSLDTNLCPSLGILRNRYGPFRGFVLVAPSYDVLQRHAAEISWFCAPIVMFDYRAGRRD
jgi:hypothetical protein